MPANLTPEYLAAEERFRQATSTAEKIEALEAMLTCIPKHKGTEHMRADIKRRLSRLRQEASQKKGGGDRFAFARIERQGAGQVVLLGYPNVGKSALLSALTHAHSPVADYPFTTQFPIPGMMDYKDVQVQIIDTPPTAPALMEPWVPDLLRRADGVLLVADLSSDDVLEQVEALPEMLAKVRIVLCSCLPKPETREPFMTYRPTLVVANKADTEGASERQALLEELCQDRFPIAAVSAMEPESLEPLRAEIWKLLGMIRVYAKEPGHPPDREAPFVLKQGSTVQDLAVRIHKGLLEHFPYARIWGSAKFPGQNVERDYVLQDGDVVELHR